MIARRFLLSALVLGFGLTASPAAAIVGFTPAPGSPFDAGFVPNDVAAGDLNGDFRDDAVTATGSNPGRIGVLLSGPSGALTAISGSPFVSGAGAPLGHVALADMNRDGRLDVVASTDSVPGQVVVMLGAGNGTFTPAPGSPTSVNAGMLYPHEMTVADVTGDNIPDVVTANFAPAMNGSVSVLKGSGTGGLAPISGSPFSTPAQLLYDVDVADINGDGRRDLVWIHYTPVASAYYRLQDANGGFGAPSAAINASVGGAPNTILARDVDGDGKVDLVFTNSINPTSALTVLKGSGQGGFAGMAGSPYPTMARAGYETHAVDVDADGKVELVSAHDNGDVNAPITQLSVLTPNANGGFALVQGSPFAFGTIRATNLALGDFDFDAQPDFATADSRAAGKVGVLLNVLAGSLTPAPGSVRFGTVGFGQAATSPVQLTNTGTGFSRLARISLRGANPGDFNVNNGCAAQLLLRAATCTLGVIFTPRGTGPRSAVLDLHQLPGGVVSIPLTGSGPTPPADRSKPVLSGLRLSPKRFRARKKGSKAATTISLRLSEAARLRFAIQRGVPGRRSGKRCVKPKRSLAKSRRCTRYVAAGSFSKTGKAGANKVSFTGRLGRRVLKPGRYRLLVTATDAARNKSKQARASFTVLAPKR